MALTQLEQNYLNSQDASFRVRVQMALLAKATNALQTETSNPPTNLYLTAKRVLLDPEPWISKAALILAAEGLSNDADDATLTGAIAGLATVFAGAFAQ